ncbi:MAG: SpoIIE family protein phosphatase [Firmicutes bacterium]|nr:SpoIIE family protein phosphatase [Bacillota bacterium]
MENSKLLFNILKYAAFFALFYALHLANISGVYAFAFGMLFALVWCNQKLYILAPLYIIAAFLAFFTLEAVIIAGATAAVFALAYLAHYKLKRPLNLWLIGLYALLSQGVFLYFNLTSPESIVACIITLVLGMICMAAYLHIFQNVLLKGLKRRFTIDELVSGGIFLLAVGIGLSCVPEIGLCLVKFAAVFAVLIACFLFSAPAGIFVGVILGAGASLAAMDISFMSTFTLYGLVAGAFKTTNKAYAAAAVVLIDIFMGLFFSTGLLLNYWMAAPAILAALLVAAIPNKTIKRLAGVLISDDSGTAERSIINRSREALCRRLLEISEVFLEMQHVFRGMVKGTLPIEEAKDYLAGEVVDKLCKNCPERTRCLMGGGGETKRVLTELMGAAFLKGKITLLDVPHFLSAKCTKVNVVIGTINQIVTEYRGYVKATNNIDASRVLIGEQLLGVSHLMLSLADEVKRNITFDTSKESKIIEDLLYKNITCTQAVVYEQSRDVCSVTLVVKNRDVTSQIIPQVVGGIVGSKMLVTGANISDKATYSVVDLRTAPKLDMVFGSAGAKKHGSKISGDTHSILRINDDKYLLALCDGMGSGEKAEKTSALAISLIENFYKAGFDSGLILSSVNKLLGLGHDETFSAVDVSVVNLRNGLCDIIKVGAPVGFIKHTDNVEIVESGALPLGILDSVAPAVTSALLSDTDMLVLCTDGLIDSFADINELGNFINNVRTTNPQTLADALLDEALKLCKSAPKDDLTVLVGRVFNKN